MLIRIAGVQFSPTFMDREANLSAIADSIRELSREEVSLAVFPEAAVTGYGFENAAEALPLAEAADGDSVARLTPLCRELKMHVVVGTLERAAAQLYNTALLVGPDGLVGSYRKVHLPFLGMDRFTTHGDRPFAVFSAGPLRVGMLICYDGAFPEAARCLALLGADLIVLPTNWPPGAECTCEHLSNARALENNIYFAAVNRVGTERGFRFIGGSRICDPSGRTIADAPHDHPAVVMAEVELERARNKHIVRVPNLHEIDRFGDRRPELYGPITAANDRPNVRQSKAV